MDNLIERLKIVEKRCRLLIHRHSVDNLRIHHQKCKQHFPFVRQPAITGRAAPREQTPLGCVCVLPKDTRLCLQHSMVIIYSSISCGIPIATANTTLGHSLPWVRERVHGSSTPQGHPPPGEVLPALRLRRCSLLSALRLRRCSLLSPEEVLSALCSLLSA